MEFSYAKIDNYCSELYNISNEIREELENVKNKVNKISGQEIWQGDAAEVYMNKFKEISANFSDVSQELEKAILYLASCSSNYEELENKIISEISNNLNIER